METEWKPMWMRKPKPGRVHVFKLKDKWYIQWLGADGYTDADVTYKLDWAIDLARAIAMGARR